MRLVRSLAKRRIQAVLPHVNGRLLDVGCGSNQLVRHYANGVGVDVHPWPGADVIVSDTATLAFEIGVIRHDHDRRGAQSHSEPRGRAE